MKLDYTAREALAISRGNWARSWLATDDGAGARLRAGGFVNLRHQPRFALDRDAPIFTVGSCFARNVENTLLRCGLPMLLKPHGIPAEDYHSWDEKTRTGGGVPAGQTSRGAFNKYSVHSMSHELRRVILDETYKNDGLIELSKDLWFDPHASMLRNGPFDSVMANRKRIAAAMREIRNAKVVFMTLGLTETWIDDRTGLAMNTHPGPQWLARMGDRFRFVDYGYDGILAEMTRLIELVRDRVSSDVRFVVTVSPVPLGSTFKDLDVIVANSGSKAVLRAVADELVRRYEGVDYFPSYEFVTNTARTHAWNEDQLHVAPPMVKAITERFVELYYAAKPTAEEETPAAA